MRRQDEQAMDEVKLITADCLGANDDVLPKPIEIERRPPRSVRDLVTDYLFIKRSNVK